jgi:hypothetical protein
MMEIEVRKIRRMILVFIILLVLSGLTAFPIRSEIAFLMQHKTSFPPFLENWIIELYSVIGSTPDIMLYGTDWLAFAHLVIALFFIGVYIDPVRNKYNVIAGMTSCLAIFPLAFIMGPIRGIPFFHQVIDCSFGVFGFLPLYFIYKKIKQLETEHYELIIK